MPSTLLIGRGPWGRNIARSLRELGHEPTVVGRDRALAALRSRAHSHVLVATPLSTHVDLVKEALLHELPVFCEKPLAPKLRDVEELHAWWQSVQQPRFLVDSVHLFTEELERLHTECTAAPLSAAAHAAFGGPGPVRADCTGLWDYGWHALSCLYAVGVPMTGWSKTYDAMWFMNAAHPGFNIAVSNKWEEKIGALDIGVGRFTREGECGPGCHTYRAYAPKPPTSEPPLKRALRLFLDPSHDWKSDYRFGFSLPLAVTAALESLGPSKT